MENYSSVAGQRLQVPRRTSGRTGVPLDVQLSRERIFWLHVDAAVHPDLVGQVFPCLEGNILDSLPHSDANVQAPLMVPLPGPGLPKLLVPT